MHTTIKKLSTWLSILVLVLAFGYYYRLPINQYYQVWLNQFLPCRQPILYSLGAFDERFGLSEKEWLSAISDAEKIWESSAGKELFAYDPQGALKINFIYDDRQASTQELQRLGLTISDDQKTYDQLEAKYQAAIAEYQQTKAAYEKLLSSFRVRENAYVKAVDAADRRGGARAKEYQNLEQERLALNAMVDQINQLQDQLNALVDTVNALANTLNRIAYQLNLTVESYNTIGGVQGEEYDQGWYRFSPSGNEIDIFQFEDHTKLVRVLAHEMGHALGLQHVEDPQAVMYRLNQGQNEIPTAVDLAELKFRCQLP